MKRIFMSLVLLSLTTSVYAMNQKQLEQKRIKQKQQQESTKRLLEQQKLEEKNRRQREIDRAAQQRINAARSTQRVSIDPRASQQKQFAATNHNVFVPHHQMQARNKK